MIAKRRTAVSLTLLIFAAFVILTSDASGATIRNIPRTPHNAPPGTSLADLAAAIAAAAMEQNWKITSERPGFLTASLLVRQKHQAIVNIGYDASDFWIDYADSVNLDYNPNDLKPPGRHSRVMKGPRIHKNYNQWVDDLSRRILIHAKTPPKAGSSLSEPRQGPVVLSDELEKLDALRRRGVLNQAEFERAKSKLLRD